MEKLMYMLPQLIILLLAAVIIVLGAIAIERLLRKKPAESRPIGQQSCAARSAYHNVEVKAEIYCETRGYKRFSIGELINTSDRGSGVYQEYMVHFYK